MSVSLCGKKDFHEMDFGETDFPQKVYDFGGKSHKHI